MKFLLGGGRVGGGDSGGWAATRLNIKRSDSVDYKKVCFSHEMSIRDGTFAGK